MSQGHLIVIYDENNTRQEYLDWQRAAPHACIYHPCALPDKVRCRICGHLKPCEEVPFYASLKELDKG